MLQFVGIRLSILGHLVCPHLRVGQNLLGVALNVVGVRLRISGCLRCRGVCVGQRLVGFLLKNASVRLGVSDHLLRCCSRIHANLVRLTPSIGDVFLGCPLG